jgi:excisionase family DNA binding protein
LEEAATYLGKTKKAVQKLVERRQIPFRRAHRRLIFDFYELDQWVASLPGTTLQEAMGRCVGATEGGAHGRQTVEVTTSSGREDMSSPRTVISSLDRQGVNDTHRREAIGFDRERA